MYIISVMAGCPSRRSVLWNRPPLRYGASIYNLHVKKPSVFRGRKRLDDFLDCGCGEFGDVHKVFWHIVLHGSTPLEILVGYDAVYAADYQARKFVMERDCAEKLCGLVW